MPRCLTIPVLCTGCVALLLCERRRGLPTEKNIPQIRPCLIRPRPRIPLASGLSALCVCAGSGQGKKEQACHARCGKSQWQMIGWSVGKIRGGINNTRRNGFPEKEQYLYISSLGSLAKHPRPQRLRRALTSPAGHLQKSQRAVKAL